MAETVPDQIATNTLTMISKTDGSESNKQNPVFSLLHNIVNFFEPNAKFPQPKRQHAVVPESADVPESTTTEDADGKKSKPDFVTFPRQSMPSVKLEADEMEPEQNTSPLVLWQVYAIGGFFIIRWALARWKERRGKKKPSNEEPSPADD